MSKLILDGTKLPYHMDRVKAWLDGERVAPITVEWALSRKCTYRCKYDNYCYTEKERTQNDVITRRVAYRFLEDCAEVGVKGVPLGCDGESTCNPIIYDVIPYSVECGLDTAMSTNGYLLDDEKLHKILPYMKYIRYNVSAAEPEPYGYVHGCHPKCFNKVYNTVKRSVELKEELGLDITIGLQMVLLPQFGSQIIPMAKLGEELGVDYTVIKHCSDDRIKGIGIDFNKYHELTPLLKQAEAMTTDKHRVVIKWSKLMSGGEKEYKYCYGPIFLQQVSSSGIIGPCGTFFNEKDKWFNVGNIVNQRYKDIVKSDHYWDVMNRLASDDFDNKKCWSMCFQHKVNQFLWKLKQGEIKLEDVIPKEETTGHVNFI